MLFNLRYITNVKTDRFLIKIIERKAPPIGSRRGWWWKETMATIILYNEVNLMMIRFYLPMFLCIFAWLNDNPMNLNSEQIRPDLSLEVRPDQTLSPKQQQEKMKEFLGTEHCSMETILGKRVFVYRTEGKQFILLNRAVSYLGGNGQHPIFKKRVQLPEWFKDFCLEVARQGLSYDVRFIGVYHYEGAVVFVDFIKDTYLKKKVHNSSAHIYINDIYQAMKKGVFHKEDMFGNHIYAVRCNQFSNYLLGRNNGNDELYDLFRKFNEEFIFGQWIYSVDKIKEMHDNEWSQWQQAEWAGWFLEYRLNAFTIEKNITHLMRYVGTSNKGKKEEGKFDFDIWFDRDTFYGDLKASDITHKEALGNDQESFVDCINRYGQFWFVIYEHETLKDSVDTQYRATIERNQYIRSIVPNYSKDDMSYASKMKNSVRFVRMSILELNRITFREVLSVFNQGHQPDGSARKPKFLIKKKDMDKYVVYRYNYVING